MKKISLSITQVLLLSIGSLGLTCAQEGAIYVSDAGNFSNPPWQIMKYDADGTNPVVFIKDQMAWPQDILFLEDQEIVLISNLTSGRINKHNAQTGTYEGIFAANIKGPTRVRFGPDGLIYVLQWGGDGQVLRYKQDGTPLGSFTSLGVFQSIGLDWDQHGNLYVSSYGRDFIRKYGPDGQDMGFFINEHLVGPTNIWFDEKGNLLVLDYDGGDIKRFDSEGNYSGVFISGLSNPEGVDFLPNGDILIGNGGTGAVLAFDKDGNPKGEWVTKNLGGLIRPNAVIYRSATAATDHQGIIEINFVTPTIGQQFTIDAERLSTFRSLEVYNANGQLIDTISTDTWQAIDRPPGQYVIKGTTDEKMVLIQRVVVTR